MPFPSFYPSFILYPEAQQQNLQLCHQERVPLHRGPVDHILNGMTCNEGSGVRGGGEACDSEAG